MRVAYLVNRYPKVSHSFIRREIAGLEACGHEVLRYSVRPPDPGLVDPEDLAEAAQTRVLLAGGRPVPEPQGAEVGPRALIGLGAAALRAGLSRPARALRAADIAARAGWRSETGVMRNLAYLAEAALLRELLARDGAEHVHAHFGTNSAAVAMLCHELGGPPFSFTVHGPLEFDRPELLGLRDKIARSTFVAGVSSFGRSQLQRHSDEAHWSKVEVVRCGLDAKFLAEPPTPVPAAPRLVCVGRLCPQKAHLVLIEAVRRLHESGRELELVLVGDGELRPAIEERIARHGLGDAVRITGWASADEVRDELLAARALVLPSFAEGLPVVLMEAMALGRPVVSTFIAGIPELVSPEAGWLVPAGDVDELARALRAVLDASPERLTEMGRVGRQRVAERHDAAAIARDLGRLFTRSAA